MCLAGILEQIAGSLAEAHAHGIVHRDLKPANVFLARIAGKTDTVKVLDFGLAKAFAPEVTLQDITAEDVVIGTAGYLAPEQIRCDPLDHRVDVWAIGTMVYQSLTGRLPFTGTKAEVVHRTLERSPPPPSKIRPELPETLDRVVLWALDKDPDERPGSIAELARAYALAVGAPFSLEEAQVGTVPNQPAVVFSAPPEPPAPPDDDSEDDEATVQAIPSRRSMPRVETPPEPDVPDPTSTDAGTAQSLPKPPSVALMPAVDGPPPKSDGTPARVMRPPLSAGRRTVLLVVVAALVSAAAAGLIAYLAVRLL